MEKTGKNGENRQKCVKMEKQVKTGNNNRKLSLYPLRFDKAVKDLLKVKSEVKETEK